MSHETVEQDYITKVIATDGVIGKVFSFRCRQNHIAILGRLELGEKLLRQTKSFAAIQFKTIKEGYCYILTTPSLENEKPPALKDSFVNDLASDLDFLHANKLIHGDIRFANILESDSGPKVIDFEPLLSINSITPNAQVLKARHIHPDDLKAGQISALSDRLNFGIIAQVLQGYQYNKDMLINDLHGLCHKKSCGELIKLPLLRRSMGGNNHHSTMSSINYLEII